MTSYSPTKNDVTSEIFKSRKRIKELEKDLSNPKIKGQTKIVEEIAIEQTKIYLWQKGYWILREQQLRGPADLYAYKILNYKKIEYFIDCKGIHPKANYKPAFKARISKFPIRDKILNRIQSIVYKNQIKFKDLKNIQVKII
tara:strand:- start:845 stop:1270 length:426 start_codon:yes stop_codon:yes gene_type:complete